MYYVCNNPNPMEIPRGVTINLLDTVEAARSEALSRAEDSSELTWYVHEFGSSTVVYRASAVVTIDSEVLNGAPESE